MGGQGGSERPRAGAAGEGHSLTAVRSSLPNAAAILSAATGGAGPCGRGEERGGVGRIRARGTARPRLERCRRPAVTPRPAGVPASRPYRPGRAFLRPCALAAVCGSERGSERPRGWAEPVGAASRRPRPRRQRGGRAEAGGLCSLAGLPRGPSFGVCRYRPKRSKQHGLCSETFQIQTFRMQSALTVLNSLRL